MNIDPNKASTPPAFSEQESAKLDELPTEMLQEILTKLEEFPSEAGTNKLWYKTITVIYQNRLNDQIQEAFRLIVPEVEKLGTVTLEAEKVPEGELVAEQIVSSGNSKKVAEELKKLLPGKEFTPRLDSRMDIKLSYDKTRRNIIDILKNLSETELEKVKGILLSQKSVQESDTPVQDLPLFAKLLAAAALEKKIEIKDNRYDFGTINYEVVPYAKMTNDEEKIISLAELFGNKNNYFNTTIDSLLSSDNLENIKTAIRLMAKLKDENFTFTPILFRPDVVIGKAIRTLLWENNFRLILKAAEVFNQPKLKEIYSDYVPQLSKGKKIEVAGDVIKQINMTENTEDIDQTLKPLLAYCISSLFAEGKIAEGFELINDLIDNEKFDVGRFFSDHLTQFISEIPNENLDKINRRIITIPTLSESPGVKIFLERVMSASIRIRLTED